MSTTRDEFGQCPLPGAACSRRDGNGSLTPLNIDFALIVFCRGKELQAGDDRKIVVPGLYVDKHFTDPGKDADDSHQDGRGAMGRDQGICSIEWAIPLDSGDVNDIQVKPGDAVCLNLAYFDAFQADLKGTQAGIAWGGDLDHATNWGVLQLAADVQDDGGRAFKGPAWIDALLQDLPGPVANRLRLTDSALVSGTTEPLAKALVEYTYLDTQGRETLGKAKIYFPLSVQDGKTRAPLYYSAGYELDDRSASIQVGRGYTVVTPRDIKANPLVQTPNPDLALLHIARSLPFVDDARVVIGGGSRGIYDADVGGRDIPVGRCRRRCAAGELGLQRSLFPADEELEKERGYGTYTTRITRVQRSRRDRSAGGVSVR